MRSRDEQPSNESASTHYYIVSGEEMNRIIVPLTVVHTYAQLLRRRIKKNGSSGIGDLDQALAHMEEATRTMAADVGKIMRATSHPPGTRTDPKGEHD